MKLVKKIISIVLSMVLSLSLLTVSFAEPSSDGSKTKDVDKSENTDLLFANVDNNTTDNLYTDIMLRACFYNNAGSVDYVNVQISEGKNYMFLPSNADYKNMIFDFNQLSALFIDESENAIQIKNGEVVDISKYLSKPLGDGSRVLKLTAVVNGDFKDYSLYFIKSENIASMYVKSADPANKGLYYVASVKGNQGSGALDMINSDGSVVYSGILNQIKGRGNSTWAALKKPFQIKLKTATDLIETGDTNNKSKTWVLLANAFDPTLIHNTVAYNMAKEMGIIAPDCRPVDLYYDGQYLGSYLLTEKVESGKGRVPIGDKGYLLEMDIMYGNQEDNYITDEHGNVFVVKEPDDISKDNLKILKAYFDEIVLALSNNGISPVTGLNIADLVDLESLAKMYVLEELTGDPDAFVSSIYFYLNEGGKLTAGPVWDFDSSFGVRTDIGANRTSGLTTNMGWIGDFLNLPEFKKLVRDVEVTLANPIATKYVKTKIDEYVKQISSSQRMDELLWSEYNIGIYYETDNFKSDIKYMKNYILARNSWLYGHVGR